MVNYGNWIRRRILVIILTAGIVLVLLALLPLHALIRAGLLLAGGLTLATAGIALYAYVQFSASGGNYQAKLWAFVLDHLKWDGGGAALDIGTGNGPLAIILAQRHPPARVTGIDYWGKNREYSQQVCEANAALEGVADRVTFRKASASDLPFEDGAFDAVVSHFVFHEVADADDKREVIREALRVLRKGGAFAFQDMFWDTGMYGDADSLLAAIQSWGIDDVQLVDTRAVLGIPRLMRLPSMLGYAALIHGTK